MFKYNNITCYWHWFPKFKEKFSFLKITLARIHRKNYANEICIPKTKIYVSHTLGEITLKNNDRFVEIILNWKFETFQRIDSDWHPPPRPEWLNWEKIVLGFRDFDNQLDFAILLVIFKNNFALNGLYND